MLPLLVVSSGLSAHQCDYVKESARGIMTLRQFGTAELTTKALFPDLDKVVDLAYNQHIVKNEQQVGRAIQDFSNFVYGRCVGHPEFIIKDEKQLENETKPIWVCISGCIDNKDGEKYE